MAAGVPGIGGLTDLVEAKLTPEEGETLGRVKELLPTSATVEGWLSKVRQLVAAMSDTTKALGVFSLDKLTTLDHSICNAIRAKVGPVTGLNLPYHRQFASYLRNTSSRAPVELFTLNYDRLLECTLELDRIPYFDGFVGFDNAAFQDHIVSDGAESIPFDWPRIWKMHGSVGWYADEAWIVRRRIEPLASTDEQLVFPSTDTYRASRLMPYLVIQDRLRHFLATQDVILLVVGYSWGDQHINQVITSALEANPRLHVVVAFFGDIPDPTRDLAIRPNNLTVTSPTAVIRRTVAEAWDSGVKSPLVGCRLVAMDPRGLSGVGLPTQCTRPPSPTGGHSEPRR